MGEIKYIDSNHSDYLPAEFTQDWCVKCETPRSVVDKHVEEYGYEEQTREYHVVDLSCGHEIVTQLR